jgi:P2X purinoceptor 4
MALAYTTQKSVVIKSWRLGMLYYALVLAVCAYVGYVLIWTHHGHQLHAPAAGNVGLKVKGQATLEVDGETFVYDANDLVTYEPSGFFIATSLSQTLQARGTCPGTDSSEACEDDAGVCVAGKFSPSGLMTGECVATSDGVKRCLVDGWCPGEPEDDISRELKNIGEFTVFVRMTVEFPGIVGGDGQTLSWSNLNGTTPTMGWNLFTLDDLLASGGITVGDIAEKGYDGRLDINFDCNLDLGVEKCAPETPFELHRVDSPLNTLSKGYNVRWISARNVGEPADRDGVTFYKHGANKDVRLLVKGYGPRIRLSINGNGRRFDVLTLSTTLGAGVAFLGIASLIVNGFMLYASSDKKRYEEWLFSEYQDDVGSAGSYGAVK